jgi:hypothetical protein
LRDLIKISRAQRELVINSLIAPDTGIGMTGGTMEIHGPIALEEFEDVINQLVQYHDAPRIRFKIVGGEVLQYLNANDQSLRLQYEDWSLKTNPEILVKKRILIFVTCFVI